MAKFQNQNHAIIETQTNQHAYDMPTYRRLGVYAEPVNQYVTPAASDAAKLADALGGVQSSLSKIGASVKEDEQRQKHADQLAFLDLAHSVDDIRSVKEKTGELPPMSDPIALAKFDQIIGGKAGDKFNLMLQEAVVSQGLDQSTDKAAMAKVIEETKQKFLEQDGMKERMGSAAYSAGFSSATGNFIQRLQAHHIDTVNTNMRNEFVGNYAASVMQASKAFKLPSGHYDLDAIGSFMNTESDKLYAGNFGINGTQINKMNVELLSQLAVDSKDSNILSLAEKIKAGSGFLSGTAEFIKAQPQILNKIGTEIRREKAERLQLRGQQVSLLHDRVMDALESGKNPKALLDSPEFSEVDRSDQMAHIRRATIQYQRFQQGNPEPFDDTARQTIISTYQKAGADPMAVSDVKNDFLAQFAGNKKAAAFVRDMALNARSLQHPINTYAYTTEVKNIRAANQSTFMSMSNEAIKAENEFRGRYEAVYRLPADDLYTEYKKYIPDEHKGKMMPFLPVIIQQDIAKAITEPLKTRGKGSAPSMRTDARMVGGHQVTVEK